MISTTRARGWRSRLPLLAVLSLLLSIPIGLATQTPAQAATTITVFAGTGAGGYNGDNQPATSATLAQPMGLATDAAGNVYIADSQNNAIRKVNTSGTITTVQGTPPTGKLATQGGLNRPGGVVVSQSGELFVADTNNSIVWKEGSAFAGNNCGVSGFGGDGGDANTPGPAGAYLCPAPYSGTPAKLNLPRGVAYDDTVGMLYIADQNNCRIRQAWNGPFGAINTVAGNGTCAYSGDGGLAKSASLRSPGAVAVWNRKLYIADTGNERVRVVDLSTGVISPFAGNGTSTSNGDGGQATSAGVTGPSGLAVDPAGNEGYSRPDL